MSTVQYFTALKGKSSDLFTECIVLSLLEDIIRRRYKEFAKQKRKSKRMLESWRYYRTTELYCVKLSGRYAQKKWDWNSGGVTFQFGCYFFNFQYTF